MGKKKAHHGRLRPLKLSTVTVQVSFKTAQQGDNVSASPVKRINHVSIDASTYTVVQQPVKGLHEED